MMLLSKHNRWPFAILVLAFIAYFSLWAYINQHAQMQVNWPRWRGYLLVGSLFLVWVYFVARDKYFDVFTVLVASIIPLLLGLIWLLGVVVIYWQLPELRPNDVAALFLIEGYAVMCGGVVESL
ncbi:hypothetical protein ACE2AK_22450 [Rahnella perminowiae]|uniref:hypothetical protein n=1 Tax=Rahnella perminowiae TaxID=2816244 RepID=UPI003653ECDC